MSSPTNTPPTALDELLRRNPKIAADVLRRAQEIGETLRRLGLLTTTPREAIRPFRRQPPRKIASSSDLMSWRAGAAWGTRVE